MDKLQKHTISTQRTARFYTLGELSAHTKHIIIAFHGYGQLGSFFGKKFSTFNANEVFVIVPEGLSRFYLNDSYQRVGASWITKDDKEGEIKDMMVYLNKIMSAFEFPAQAQVHLFGFSQGCTALLRWLHQTSLKISSIILWAGYFAHPISSFVDSEKIEPIQKIYVYGDQDEFLIQSPQMASQMKTMLQDFNFSTIEFKGEHRVPLDELIRVFEKIGITAS